MPARAAALATASRPETIADQNQAKPWIGASRLGESVNDYAMPFLGVKTADRQQKHPVGSDSAARQQVAPDGLVSKIGGKPPVLDAERYGHGIVDAERLQARRKPIAAGDGDIETSAEACDMSPSGREQAIDRRM